MEITLASLLGVFGRGASLVRCLLSDAFGVIRSRACGVFGVAGSVGSRLEVALAGILGVVSAGSSAIGKLLR